MALTKGMAYDHPDYTTTKLFGGTAVAGASGIPIRFAAVAAMVAKSGTITVVTAGTGTGNATVTFTKIASGGTAITTLAQVVMSTLAAGITTNVALNTNANSTFAAGDVSSCRTARTRLACLRSVWK
jgi:hypothetical protein